MKKLFNILAWLILLFVIMSTRLNIVLSTPMTIILCVFSAIMLCIGIITDKDKTDNERK